MALSEAAARYAYAWGALQNAVANRASTADIFATVRQVAEDLGMDTPPGMWAAVNELRSLAVAERNAGEAFQRTDPAERLTAALAPPDINARNIEDRNIFPEYLVRFDMTHTDTEGNAVTITRSFRDTWTPGLTVGEVTGLVTEAATGLANEYGIDLAGVDNLRVVSV